MDKELKEFLENMTDDVLFDPKFPDDSEKVVKEVIDKYLIELKAIIKKHKETKIVSIIEKLAIKSGDMYFGNDKHDWKEIAKAIIADGNKGMERGE